jgi:hypothetical protein
LCGLEGHGGVLPTLRAGRFGFGTLKRGTLARAISTLGFAGLAPLGFILETLIGEKHLLAGGEDKFCITFRAP